MANISLNFGGHGHKATFAHPTIRRNVCPPSLKNFNVGWTKHCMANISLNFGGHGHKATFAHPTIRRNVCPPSLKKIFMRKPYPIHAGINSA